MPRLCCRRILVTLTVCCSGLCPLECPIGTAQQDATFQSGGDLARGLLVLRNGNVLKGRIQRQAEHYRIQSASAELLIRAELVESYCHNLDEAYEQRRLRRTASSADSHIELARWCLRHELLDYASRELLDARTIDPDHRKLSLLERQLQFALQNRQAREASKPLVNQPASDGEELESIADVPDWARTLFVRQVQPLLVNSCATSGCHQSDSGGSFQLNRLAVEGAGHPATTLSNLSSTWAQLDLNSPSESALLVHAKKGHGTNDSKQQRPLKRHQYQMLLTWVEQLALAQKDAPVKEIALATHLEEGTVNALPLIRQALEQSETSEKDPFDPERFNRRFGARSDATDQATANPAESD